MNAMSPHLLSRKDRLAAGRAALAGIFPDMIDARPGSVGSVPRSPRRAEMRVPNMPDQKPDPSPAIKPEVTPEPERRVAPDPAPALDETTLGNLALNTGEQALGIISDLLPSPKRDPEPDQEVEDPFGPSAVRAQANPEDPGKRILKEMQLSFQALFGLGGKTEPDHKASLKPEQQTPSDIPETEIFRRENDDPELPRPSMM